MYVLQHLWSENWLLFFMECDCMIAGQYVVSNNERKFDAFYVFLVYFVVN